MKLLWSLCGNIIARYTKWTKGQRDICLIFRNSTLRICSIKCINFLFPFMCLSSIVMNILKVLCPQNLKVNFYEAHKLFFVLLPQDEEIINLLSRENQRLFPHIINVYQRWDAVENVRPIIDQRISLAVTLCLLPDSHDSEGQVLPTPR